MCVIGSVGNSGAMSSVTIKCFSLFIGLTAVHLVLSSFLGLVIRFDKCIVDFLCMCEMNQLISCLIHVLQVLNSDIIFNTDDYKPMNELDKH